MTGRPSDYTPQIADAICAALEEGESLVQICKSEHMPGVRTVYYWLERHEDFAQRYARARDRQADTVAEMAVAEAIQAKDAQLGRLAYDARKWWAGKLAPKKYGDKVQTEHSGPEGGPIMVVTGVPRAGE